MRLLVSFDPDSKTLFVSEQSDDLTIQNRVESMDISEVPNAVNFSVLGIPGTCLLVEIQKERTFEPSRN